MKVVALVSGGKDSCYNMLQCIAAGHEIIALANLCPEAKEEIDSYMYQSVGYEGIELYSEAMNLPLYRRTTKGKALNQDKFYVPTSDDEVEDLYELLKQVKDELNIEAVAVGAVLSDYQRVRVENVCSRLGIMALAYLWRRDQEELLQEMIDCNIKAIVVKVAALGLHPNKHLGLTIAEIKSHLVRMKEKYGLNICGEGGEYETFTLDCPLFTKTIHIDDQEIVIHSDDAFAPVGYLNFKKLSLLDKDNPISESNGAEDSDSTTTITMLDNVRVKNPDDYVVYLDDSRDPFDLLEDENALVDQIDALTEMGDNSEMISVKSSDYQTRDLTTIATNENNWCWVGSLIGNGDDIAEALKSALDKLSALLSSKNFTLKNVICLTLYIRDMAEYPLVNEVYHKYFNHTNPPIRACVQTILPDNVPVILDAVCKNQTEHNPNFLHVNDIIYIAGMIPLVPGSMKLLEAGILQQCKLALRHVHRGFCFVTNKLHIDIARREWEKRTNNGIVDYIVVTGLPRNALVEWYVWAHRANNTFQYEETGYCLNDHHHVSLRRRWNYDNSVSAIVCYVSNGLSLSIGNVAQVTANQEEDLNIKTLPEATLLEIVQYVMSRLLNENKQLTYVANFKIFYKASAMNSSVIENVFHQLIQQYTIVPTIIPVKHLQNPNTIVSICALRHY
ncbi:hypothetical protein M8J76_007020 [Diaphorina citri]|nr:hypothetical protein M8J76_007020 [Diaphorina citri]